MILGNYYKNHSSAIKVTTGVFVLGDQVNINGVVYTVISKSLPIKSDATAACLWLDRPLEEDVRDMDQITYAGKWSTQGANK